MRLGVIVILTLSLLTSCLKSKDNNKEITPWGSTVSTVSDEDTIVSSNLSLADIITQGEMIMLTVTGPQTYYDYHGHGMGLHYLLCEKFASKIGVKLRVEVCKDSAELATKIRQGDADIVACPIKIKGTTECGPEWAVNKESTELADSIKSWYKPEMLKEIENQQKTLLANGGVTRRVYSPMLNRQKGVISRWDALFIKYSPVCRLDWRLMAAQCYQESCFDPKARSWAGACGLMQIMPSTAAHLGLPANDLFSPEPNIAAAAKYMRELLGAFNDIPKQGDRICFALAAYNGGAMHIRDAMALAKKYGRNPQRWNDVREFVLKLSDAAYYTDPVVKHGYMRGSETANYVSRIMQRWNEYGGSAGRAFIAPSVSSPANTSVPGISLGDATPHRAKKKNKYQIN